MGFSKYLRAYRGVFFNTVELLICEPALFVENSVGYAYLAYVLQMRGDMYF